MFYNTLVYHAFFTMLIKTASIQVNPDSEAKVMSELDNQKHEQLTIENEKMLSYIYATFNTDIRIMADEILAESREINEKSDYRVTTEKEEWKLKGLYYLIMMDVEGKIPDYKFGSTIIVSKRIRKPEFMIKKSQEYLDVLNKLETLYAQNRNAVSDERNESNVLYEHPLISEEQIQLYKGIITNYQGLSRKIILLGNCFALRKFTDDSEIYIFKHCKNEDLIKKLNISFIKKRNKVYEEYVAFNNWVNQVGFENLDSCDFKSLNEISDELHFSK